MALFLNDEEVARLLPMNECIEVLDQAFAHAGEGKVDNHPRDRIRMPGGFFHFMAASNGGQGVFGYKAYPSFGGPSSAKMIVMLYDYETGGLLSCMEASRLGQIRTGAASGLATKYMAKENSATVAVIGSEVAEKFFRLRDPLGALFRIDQQLFRVIGVLEPVGLSGGAGTALVGRDLNKDVHIPLTTAELQFQDIVVRRTTGSFSGEEVELSEVYLTTRSTEDVLTTAARVRRLMDVRHGDTHDVQIIVPWELLEEARKTALVWNVVLISVAAISLLVGGIGIMHIILASVP